ncbi:MAG: hypothetical protein GY817_01145 [bacterium]|nr:hypothetical protein [bacterium]
MDVLSVIFGKRNLSKIEYDKTGVQHFLNFDVCKQISHSLTSTITKSGVEDGGNIADHVVLNNKTATFDIIISDTPLNVIKSAVTGMATSFIADKIKTNPLVSLGAAKIAGLILDKSVTKSQDAFNLLEELRDQRTPIKAIIGFKSYKNAIITNLKVTQNAVNAGSLNANLTIEEITVVKTKKTLIPKELVDKSVEGTATSEADTGKQKTKTVTDKTKSVASSILSKFTGVGA